MAPGKTIQTLMNTHKWHVAGFLILALGIAGCDDQPDELMIEYRWENHYVITNQLNSDLIIRSYLTEMTGKTDKTDTISAGSVEEWLHLGGVGKNVGGLSDVFDSLMVFEQGTGNLLYRSDLAFTDEWQVDSTFHKHAEVLQFHLILKD